MRKIFKSDNLNLEFHKLGYTKVPFTTLILLDKFREKIKALKPSDGFEAYQKNLIHPQDYHCTFFDTDKTYRTKVFEIVLEFFEEAAKELLVDYDFIQANVFIKPSFKGYVAAHQNLTVVDETQFTSVSFWCPAQDTNIANGTMLLVPRSHKKFMKYRSTNICWPLLPLFEDYTSPFLKAIDVKAGELLIIDDRIVHGTSINQTPNERFVFHAMLAPKEAQTIYCEIDQENKVVRRYAVDRLFWQYYLPGSKPQGLELIDTLPYNESAMSVEAFQSELHGSANC
ncbi:MAG: phytanoyl-CoA dioxygenase family protein [Chitinophagales bacterium]|nr:phytanoyl-CoA dioxygenase family protein [Chitinophagales bacterium]